MRYLALLIFCLSLSFACSNACPVPPAAPEVKQAPAAPLPEADAPRPPPPSTRLHFLADVDFTELERAHVRNAATAWTVFSGHPVDSEFTADVVNATREDLERMRDNPTIFRIDSTFDVVRLADAEHPGMKVLAFTVPSEGHVFMIMDRIDPDQFVWIVVHEMGHVLGLRDLDEGGHVMSGVGRFRNTWFDDADREECRRAKVCP